MNPDLGDLLTDFPLSTLAVHLGSALPVGVPSLASLVDASFSGYQAAPVANGIPSDQGTGFSFLSCQVQFVCTDEAGASAACLWVTAMYAGAPVLIAYQTLEEGEVSFAGVSVLTLNLTITIFQAPSGFYG